MTAFEDAYALVVGIANYQLINPLPQTVLSDAQDISDMLKDPKRCGYKPENVQLLPDVDATKKSLTEALANIAQRSSEDSTAFIYFSGHGGRIESGPRAGEYLLPVDTDNSSEAALVSTAISGGEFSEALRTIAAGKVMVMFDCCHAGGIGQPKTPTSPVLKAGLSESYYDALRTGRGRVILASSLSTELSWVLPNAANSLFTTHLLAGLRGGIASEDGLIRIFDLFEYIQPRVTGDQPQQHPVFKADLQVNFPIALYLGGEKGVVPRDNQGFRYDAYISFVDEEPDADWVKNTLVPRLKEAGLRVALSADVEVGGVYRVVNLERGITQAKRIVVVLSNAYLADRSPAGHWALFENVLGETMGIQEGAYRLLPIKIAPIDNSRLPVRLSMLSTLDLATPSHADRDFQRLVQDLKGPLPQY
jgi:hypothetical protein